MKVINVVNKYHEIVGEAYVDDNIYGILNSFIMFKDVKELMEKQHITSCIMKFLV